MRSKPNDCFLCLSGLGLCGGPPMFHPQICTIVFNFHKELCLVHIHLPIRGDTL